MVRTPNPPKTEYYLYALIFIGSDLMVFIITAALTFDKLNDWCAPLSQVVPWSPVRPKRREASHRARRARNLPGQRVAVQTRGLRPLRSDRRN